MAIIKVDDQLLKKLGQSIERVEAELLTMRTLYARLRVYDDDIETRRAGLIEVIKDRITPEQFETLPNTTARYQVVGHYLSDRQWAQAMRELGIERRASRRAPDGRIYKAHEILEGSPLYKWKTDFYAKQAADKAARGETEPLSEW